MPEMIAPIAGSVVGGLMSDGGSTQQTASKEPWAAAAPWLKDLLSQGQNLSAYYTANPFNAAQTQAYGNMANQSAYMRSLVPGLLSQLQAQPVGFDRSNPNLRPQAFNFGLLGGGSAPAMSAGQGSGMGLLGGGGLNPVSTLPPSLTQAPMPTLAPTAAPVTGNYFMYGGNKIPVGYDRDLYGDAGA